MQTEAEDRRRIWLAMEVMDKIWKEKDIDLAVEAKVIRDKLEVMLEKLNKRVR